MNSDISCIESGILCFLHVSFFVTPDPSQSILWFWYHRDEPFFLTGQSWFVIHSSFELWITKRKKCWNHAFGFVKKKKVKFIELRKCLQALSYFLLVCEFPICEFPYISHIFTLLNMFWISYINLNEKIILNND